MLTSICCKVHAATNQIVPIGFGKFVEVVPADTPQSILPETAGTESQTGGVQNWRVYEMSETAVELPVIEEDNPLLAVTLWCTLGLFLASIVLRVIKYYYDTGEKPHAFHKSQ